MFDADTNRDGKLDSSDIKSLYLSEISGKRFTKVSMDLQELIDWNLIDSKAAFRTVEDTNKMGSLIKTMWCITTTLICQIMNGKYLTTNQFNSIVNRLGISLSKSDFQ
jgi:hypothetical protein